MQSIAKHLTDILYSISRKKSIPKAQKNGTAVPFGELVMSINISDIFCCPQKKEMEK